MLLVPSTAVVAETGMRRLRHALKILSEAEKHLRASKNQSTWVTVALLQFGSVESSLLESNDMQSRASYSRGKYSPDCYLNATKGLTARK
jgi:hypothetical protein